MDRRTFLRLLGASATLVALPPRLHAGRGFKVWHWTHARSDATDAELRAHFAAIAGAGVDAILLGGATPRATALAAAASLEVHAWMWTLCRGDAELAAEHPAWYAVSREGKSTLTDPPYVGYYKFLCPNHAGVHHWLAAKVAAFAADPNLTGIHLDYVRFPDVILPRALWPKYDLVQHEELPPYDFCYCAECRRRFREQTGHDPLALPDPPADLAWRHFRWHSITRLVTRLADVAHAHDKQITAAVFPTPTIARRLVRQDWPRWPLDAVLPMIYHNFYEEPVAWIENAVREGVEALAGRMPLHAGLYLPAFEDDEARERASELARCAGANGVGLFGRP